ncbi:MAG: hypothetical protein P4L53_22575 [Candidatus Obscuribacterales bacterium]|nr:hypothetical protein [Candidatus Obscuribacterales bacterium]
MKKALVRRQKGFSLVTVLSVTLLATLWLTATLANLIAVYRSASTSKFSGEIINHANSATAFVLQALNDSTQAATFDNKSNVPLSGTVWGASPDVRATISVVSQNPSAASLLIDGTSSNTVATKTNPSGSNYSVANSAWRIITITVQYAGLTKTLQVYALRRLPAPSPGNGSSTLPANIPFGSPTGTSPFFAGAILSTGSMQLGSNFSSSGYDFVAKSPVTANDGIHALGGDITSYSPVNLSGTNVSIGGSLTAMSASISNSPVTAQTQTPASTTVNRYVNTSGNVAGFNDGSGNFGQTTTNVLGLTNSNMQSQTQSIETQQNAANAQANNPVIPSPTAPSTATTIGGITVSASNPTLAAGDYATGSLVVPSSATLAISGSSPARIYLADGSSGASINGTVNSGGLPANFQIFYSGTGTLDLTGATINGTVYAPNATVYMFNTTVQGAIVAGQISGGLDANGNIQPTKNVNIVYDTSLSNPSELKASKAQGLLMDPIAVQADLNGASANGAALAPLQVRYYSEQASLH